MHSIILVIGKFLFLMMIPVVIALALLDVVKSESWMDVIESVFFGCFFTMVFLCSWRALRARSWVGGGVKIVHKEEE